MYKILNFVFQFIKNMKWHFGYTDSYPIFQFLYEYFSSILLSFPELGWVTTSAIPKYFTSSNHMKTMKANRCIRETSFKY